MKGEFLGLEHAGKLVVLEAVTARLRSYQVEAQLLDQVVRTSPENFVPSLKSLLSKLLGRELHPAKGKAPISPTRYILYLMLWAAAYKRFSDENLIQNFYFIPLGGVKVFDQPLKRRDSFMGHTRGSSKLARFSIKINWPQDISLVSLASKLIRG